tara:strand:+ start:462 stop:674 length:213 start_codon:yes stop_codon:yes gene_type:complete
MDITNMMQNFLILGDLQKFDTEEEKLKYEQRIVFATMRASIPQWQPPENWEELSVKIKLDRLEKLKNINK